MGEASAGVIAQFDPNPTPNFFAPVSRDRVFAQTFTVEDAAEARQVDLTILRVDGLTPMELGDVTIEIRSTTSAGTPSSAVLTSVTVPGTSIPIAPPTLTTPFTSFVLPTPVELNAGDLYAIVATTSSPLPNPILGPYAWGGLSAQFVPFPSVTYPEGQAFQLDNTPNSSDPGVFVPLSLDDLGFRVTSTAVPEPASVTVVTLAMILLARTWYRTRRSA